MKNVGEYYEIKNIERVANNLFGGVYKIYFKDKHNLDPLIKSGNEKVYALKKLTLEKDFFRINRLVKGDLIYREFVV